MQEHKARPVDAINAIAVTLIWWPAVFLTLLNYYHFAEQHTFLAFARSLGLDHSRELTDSQILLVFSKTILFVGVILPLITFLSARLLPFKTLIKVVMAASTLLVLLNYVNLLTVAETGSLMPWELLLESMQTGLREPEFAKVYVSASSLVKLLLVLASVWVIGIANLYCYKRKFTGLAKNMVSAMLVFLAAVFPSIYVYAMAFSGSELNPGVEFVSKQVTSLFNLDGSTSPAFDGLDVDQAISRFRELVHSPLPDFDDPYYAMEAGSNLIVISLESGPAQVVNYLSDPRFKNLRALTENSFIGGHHYSTYPYTSDALFSVFTGLYPNDLRRSLLTEGAVGLNNRLKENRIGIFHALNKAGYKSKVYFSEKPLFAPDISMFSVLGADQVFAPLDAHSQSATEGEADVSAEKSTQTSGSESMLERYKRLDLIALDHLLADIQENASAQSKFASVFMPLSGHGPWPDLDPGLSLLEEGREIFLMQDEWIGEIMKKLEELGIADETVILITSDHGLRTRSEFPSLEPGVLNEMSFLVPLLIYAPNTLEKHVKIDQVTSHIDIAPSILSLLGIDSSAMLMVGSPIWEPGIESRRTYLLASDYLGVDGYFERGNFNMVQYMTGLEIQADQLFVDDPMWSDEELLTGADSGERFQQFSLLRSLQKVIQEYALSAKRN